MPNARLQLQVVNSKRPWSDYLQVRKLTPLQMMLLVSQPIRLLTARNMIASRFTLISKHLNSIHFPNSINLPVGVQASAFGE